MWRPSGGLDLARQRMKTRPVLPKGRGAGSRIRKHRIRSVYAGARQTLEVIQTDPLHFGRRRPDATQLRADAEAGRGMAEERIDGRYRQRWSSTKLWSRASSKLRNILPAPSTICTSSRNTTISDRGRSGVSRTPSLQHLRNWSRFPNSGRPRSWESFSRVDSRSRSELREVPTGPPLGSVRGMLVCHSTRQTAFSTTCPASLPMRAGSLRSRYAVWVARA